MGQAGYINSDFGNKVNTGPALVFNAGSAPAPSGQYGAPAPDPSYDTQQVQTNEQFGPPTLDDEEANPPQAAGQANQEQDHHHYQEVRAEDQLR